MYKNKQCKPVFKAFYKSANGAKIWIMVNFPVAEDWRWFQG